MHCEGGYSLYRGALPSVSFACAMREVTPFPEAKHSSALALPALENLKCQWQGYVVGPINRTPTVLSQRTHPLLFQRGCNRVLLPSSLIFENTRVLTLIISPKWFSWHLLTIQARRPRPWGIEAFTPVVIRPIAGEFQLFKNSTNRLVIF